MEDQQAEVVLEPEARLQPSVAPTKDLLPPVKLCLLKIV